MRWSCRVEAFTQRCRDRCTLLDVITPAGERVFEVDTSVVDLSEPGYYADIADRVASSIIAGENERAILFCGTGIGVCIAANKVPGIRAALTHDAYSADRAAKSNNAQIITMGARVIGPELAKAIVDVWLAAQFDPNGPSASNVEAIGRIDRKYGKR